MVDKSNAHVRQKAPPADVEKRLSESERLIADPAFERGFDGMRDTLIGLLENMQHDGSDEMDKYQDEICRSLRTLKALKRNIVVGMQGQKLHLAGVETKGE